jgi:HEAT repeat protein
MICNCIVFVALAASSCAQVRLAPVMESFQSPAAAEPDSDYEEGLRELDAREWDEAIHSFDEAANHKKGSVDAALYCKDYAQNRAGRRDEALATIASLRQSYPSSRWLKDAQALEVEIRGQAGAPVSPNMETDEDLKLMAVNSLMQTDSKQALPILQKLLAGNNSEKVKERALFVLTQNPTPEARKLLSDMARNSANPDLQMKAIRYMGLIGSKDARNDLSSIYNSSADVRVKRAILQSFMQSGSRDLLLNAAKSERNPELRRDAIRQLMLTGGQEQLWQLYQSASLQGKKTILESMFLGGNSSRVIDTAKTEKGPALRVAGIKSLGLMGGNGSGDALVSIYQSDQNREVREAVLNALFLQQNSKALVDLARSEKDPQMKKAIIQKMSLMHSKEVTDYMTELLK